MLSAVDERLFTFAERKLMAPAKRENTQGLTVRLLHPG